MNDLFVVNRFYDVNLIALRTIHYYRAYHYNTYHYHTRNDVHKKRTIWFRLTSAENQFHENAPIVRLFDCVVFLNSEAINCNPRSWNMTPFTILYNKIH